MTTQSGLSDDRIAAILANHEADPDRGDGSHTPAEVASLAREVRAARDSAGEARHDERERVNLYASTLEVIHALALAGAVDFSRATWVLDLLEDCHRATGQLRGETAGEKGGAT